MSRRGLGAVEEEFFSGRVASNPEVAQVFELAQRLLGFFIFRRVDVMNDRV